MKRISLLLLLFLLVRSFLVAQVADIETRKAIKKSIQQFAWNSPTEWMENYAWMQQQEMPYFARDTFTMTWAMDASNMISIAVDEEEIAWTVIFDPVWPNGSRTPIPERYEWRGKSCKAFAGKGHYLEDIDFVFGLDSALQVVEVEPVVRTRENGFVRLLSKNELQGVDCSECVKVTYRGEEASKRYKVGQHYRIVKKMEDRIKADPNLINQLLDRAVRESYAGFRILTIDQCHEPGRVCWYKGDGLSRTIRTYGKITASTGPRELLFEAVFHFPEGEDPVVEAVRVFK